MFVEVAIDKRNNDEYFSYGSHIFLYIIKIIMCFEILTLKGTASLGYVSAVRVVMSFMYNNYYLIYT